MRDASYSAGRTRVSEARPMFFIPRTTAAMFTGSCGSCSTIRTRASGSATLDDHWKKARGGLAIALKIDPVAPSAQRELATAAHASRGHVVRDHVERDRKGLLRSQSIERNLEPHRVAVRV